MDANELITWMNASLSTENSALKRIWLHESVYQKKLTGEGLPEEVMPGLRAEKRVEVRHGDGGGGGV